jgi:hypothetical protein
VSELEQVLEDARQRFVATFPAQCDAIGALVEEVTASGGVEAAASLAHAVHRVSGFAGTVGFPSNASARAMTSCGSEISAGVIWLRTSAAA